MRADHDNLSDVAFVIGNYMSDSSWKDFRGWLIGQGQTVYENALHDPETLTDVVNRHAREEIFGERLLYVAYIAYENKTGEMTPPVFITDEPLKGSPRITASNHDDFNQQFKAKYPRVWEKFKDGHEV